MFKVEFYCDDKKVGVALWRLLGIAIGKPEATPVVNAKPKRNGKIEQVTRSGNATDLFLAELRKERQRQINIADVRAWLDASGAAASGSAGYVLKQLKARKLIKMARGPTKGHAVKYDVLPAAFKAGA